MTLHIDIETFSECDLKSTGVYPYAEHPSTRVLCVGYRIDDGPVNLWIPFDAAPGVMTDICVYVLKQKPGTEIHVGTKVPANFVAAWHGPKRAHNAQFERVVLNGTAGLILGLPKSEREEWVCTAVKAAAMGLPRALEFAAKALGTHGKSDAGRIEMLQLSKPRKPTKADPSTRWTFENANGKWIAMLCYNVDDVLAECEVDDALPDLDPKEQQLYWLDQKINDTGWKVDLKLVHDILYVVEDYKARVAAECRELTDDWLGNGLEPTQREKIAEWVRANGFANLVDMTAEYLRGVVTQCEIPSNVRRVLTLYSTYNAKSVSKLQAMLDAVCSDGRLRGMFMFNGAATGRWSSLIVQLQNMMRPVIKDVDAAIEAFGQRDLDLIRMLWPDVDPLKVAGSCIRGCLVADAGHELVFPDYSGIEDRVNLWFFDEEQMLNVYRDYDAKRGRHPYSVTVCRAFGLNLEEFSDEDPRRQWGKVQRLALGYEGGVSAFVTMVDTYGIDLQDMARQVLPLLPPDAISHADWMREHHPNGTVSGDVETACNGLKYLWRQQHPNIVQGWKDLRHAAESAVEHEGTPFYLPNRKLAFKVETFNGRKWLSMRLPSGRKIRYYDPQWHPPVETEVHRTPPRTQENPNPRTELVTMVTPGYMDYMGTDTYTRQWMRLQTYGGKLDENADQGFSRDLLAHAMLQADAAGYRIVGSEHDKLIAEITPDQTVDDLKRIMVTQPPYAAGLPLTVDGKKVRRYGK